MASLIISTSGPTALTVRDVARRAGTSPSAVYSLFGSREQLLSAVTQEALRRFAVHLAAVRPTDDPGRDLLALGLAYRRSALADPHFYRVMFGVAPGAAPTADHVTARPTFLVLHDAVARVLGGSGPAVEAAREPALTLWCLVHGLVALELTDLLPGTAEERAERFTRALRAAGPALVSALSAPATAVRPRRPPG